eukprot:Awhi_evm1s6136
MPPGITDVESFVDKIAAYKHGRIIPTTLKLNNDPSNLDLKLGTIQTFVGNNTLDESMQKLVERIMVLRMVDV